MRDRKFSGLLPQAYHGLGRKGSVRDAPLATVRRDRAQIWDLGSDTVTQMTSPPPGGRSLVRVNLFLGEEDLGAAGLPLPVDPGDGDELLGHAVLSPFPVGGGHVASSTWSFRGSLSLAAKTTRRLACLAGSAPALQVEAMMSVLMECVTGFSALEKLMSAGT